MKKMLLPLVLATLGGQALAATTLKVQVNGMVCAFCAQGIEKRLGQLPQTRAVFVDLKQRLVAVEVKDGQTLDPATVGAEIKEAGYAVVAVETLPLSLDEVKAQARAGKR